MDVVADGMTELGEYILSLCERRNLSMRAASMGAGLAAETISQMIRRGSTTTPRPDTLRLIADYLGGNYDYMMRLAGHLPPLDNPTAETIEDFDDLFQTYEQLSGPANGDAETDGRD